MKALSLFSSAGIGDLGLRKNRIETILAAELQKERLDLFHANYPSTKCFYGDIWNTYQEICDYYISNFKEEPFLIIATPPCQGMYSNGMGKLLSDYRKGLRPELDPRNRLVIPAIEIIKKLKPKWVILENVANMINTLILNEQGKLVNIIDYIKSSLGSDYVGEPEVINCADYGIPQYRKRLITILSRTERAKVYYSNFKTFMPEVTHGENPGLLVAPWKTVRDAISKVPVLSSEKNKNKDTGFHPLHKVPLLDEKNFSGLDIPQKVQARLITNV